MLSKEEAEVLGQIVEQAATRGLPAVLKIIQTWIGAGEEITVEKILELKDKMKDPASYFE